MSYRASKGAQRRIDAALSKSRTVFYTPSVGVTSAVLRRDLNTLLTTASTCIDLYLGQDPDTAGEDQARIELVIIDEADRLSHSALECARPIRPPRLRSDSDRHAWHRKADGTIPAAL